MAQAYINHVFSNGDNLTENQIRGLRCELASKNEFSDCNEDLLIQTADEIEKVYYSENKKRKRDLKENISNKTTKLDSKFICELCDKVFKHACTLDRHLQAHFLRNTCTTCKKSFTRKSNLKRHEQKCVKLELKKPSVTSSTSTNRKKKSGLTCNHCGIPFDNYDDLFHHVSTNHPLNQSGGHKDTTAIEDTVSTVKDNKKDSKLNKKRFHFRKTALNKTVNQTSIIPYANEKYDLLQFLANTKQDVDNELTRRRAEQRNIKWYVNARVEMVRDVDEGNQDKAQPHFRSKNYISLSDENNDHNLNEAFQSVNRSLEEFINKGSNWILNKIISLEIHTVPYSPIAGSSYMKLPAKLCGTGGIINIKNGDQKCFLWSILAALHPVTDHPERVGKYLDYENELNMKDIEYPVSLSHVEKFEKQNYISVNVFGFEDGEVFPLYLSKLGNGYTEVDLLYLSNENGSHYCWIKRLDRFLGSVTRFHTKRFYCRRCLHGFIREDLLHAHRVYCNKFDFQRVTYPKEGENDILKFKDHQKMIRVPFVIYADFECFARKISTCQPDPQKSSTTHTTKFEACGFSYVVVSSNDKYTKTPVVYRGEDAVTQFFEKILQEEEYITETLSEIEPLIMNPNTENQFKNATNCYVCNRFFTGQLIKVRDHDHLGINGDVDSPDYSNYRGAACQSCNLNLQHPPFTPVYFHNLRNFDSHLLLSEAGKYKDKKLTCIPNNMEKYISFSLGKLRFLDSYQCMSSSLETLVDNLAVDGLQHFKQFRKAFQSADLAKLLLRKNVYCYDYIDCIEKFNETELPPKEAFYNSLTKESISDEDYEHAQTMWDTFNMKHLGDFHDMYVLTDTLLLCDVFERFRDMTLENYKLDASHFYTSPGLAWQAALKMSGVCLELITDPLMYNMWEIGTRGGVSMVSKKYSKANNEYVDGFDDAKDPNHIMYLDANNLYGWAMSQPLPTGFMHFLSESEIEDFDLQKIAIDSKEGYLLEVDLEYPNHLHDHHNCYPLAPEHQLIQDEDLSQYSKYLWGKLNGASQARVKSKKLIPTLKNKKNYIIHYRNLQLYLDLGMKITKIHKILGFHQMPWLKTYIDFNANMRKNARNEFEKDFFKLMCNSVFGKCMENLRERFNLSLIHSEEKLKKFVSKPSFERIQIFNEDLVGVQNKQVNLILNKPIYAGQVILDLSKQLMYEFHYKVIKPMYGDNVNLLFTDTDSLCYEVKTDDIYKDMKTIHNLLDTSNYEEGHPLYSITNKKVPGKMKDELGGIPIKEAIMMRPKMYSITYAETRVDENGDIITSEKEKKVAKGIVKCEIKKTLRHAMYKQCLIEETTTMNSMRSIRSNNHELFIDTIVKKGLCSFDDKRYWKNSIESFAFGHYKIN